MSLIVVTIRDSDDWNTHIELYNYAKDNYYAYRVLNKNKYSLVKILISTGRRNQIRCHMADIGHPILGDNRYAKKKNDPLGRLALHANRLEIINPISNKLMIFTSEIPKEFYDIVK